MQRLIALAGCLLAIAAGLIGCSMCQSPYDYCGPTVGPGGAPEAGFMDRKNSILSQGAPLVSVGPSTTTTTTPSPTPAAEPAEETAPGASGTTSGRTASAAPASSSTRMVRRAAASTSLDRDDSFNE